jgi:predicted DCC family thiol-disulfide oxidoreductase YuxK
VRQWWREDKGGWAMVKKHTDFAVLLFDGECNLCNHLVQFIIPRDPKAYYRFTALQSERGKQLLQHHHLPMGQTNTVILIEAGQLYTKSSAALRLTRKLYRFWPFLYVFRLVPAFIRDPIYDWIARNRYKWFGRREHCMIPTPDIKQRFLD